MRKAPVLYKMSVFMLTVMSIAAQADIRIAAAMITMMEAVVLTVMRVAVCRDFRDD